MRTFFALISLSICAIVLTFFIGCFYSYNYPMKFNNEIRQYSHEFNVDGAVIASIANIESNFREGVISNKGAIGIMQLMPSTAEWIAGQMKENYNEDRLKDGQYNIKLGSYYIAYLINVFGDVDLGVCAYNAGQGNVSAWLKDNKYSTDGKTLNEIPFKETKNYLNKFHKNYNYYKNRYK